MKKKILLLLVLSLLFLYPITGPVQKGWALNTSRPSLDLIIKIKGLDQTLALMDQLFKSRDPGAGASPGSILRGLIHGTDWIDFSRLIVIGIDTSEHDSTGQIFVPFIKPNENFRQAYHASSGPDFYILSLPTGKRSPGDSMKKVLADISKSKSKSTISVEIALSRLLTKSNSKIQESLSKMADRPEAEGSEKPPLTPHDLRKLFTGMLNQGSQIETLLVNMDLNRNNLVYEINAKAHTGSRLSTLFTKGDGETFLNAYKPQFQMNFRSRPFDFEKTFSFLEDTFGKFYEAIGVNFKHLVQISSSFSGEMAGGMSLDPKRMAFEIMYVLKPGISGQDFIESVYLPWMLDLGKNITTAMEKQTGQKMDPLFIRTRDSMIYGFKVAGIKTQTPFL
ncbi:MAG: hypothetical protein AB1659_13390, partial [Thermodesulfobacteriota bacterium]